MLNGTIHYLVSRVIISKNLNLNLRHKMIKKNLYNLDELEIIKRFGSCEDVSSDKFKPSLKPIKKFKTNGFFSGLCHANI
jgi:hypothetical protein